MSIKEGFQFDAGLVYDTIITQNKKKITILLWLKKIIGKALKENKLKLFGEQWKLKFELHKLIISLVNRE